MTKEEAQQAIGLNMEQIKAEKQDFIKTRASAVGRTGT
ncbi:hypothetical protein ACNKHS_24410 [Shigella flexneri]